MLESGRPLTRALPWRLGLELSGVMAGGHRILDGIDATGGDIAELLGGASNRRERRPIGIEAPLFAVWSD